MSTSVQAAVTDLADQPLFSSVSVPGNLALTVSVEYPTAVSVAYTNRTYNPATEYTGYFDPNKCYLYQWNSTDSATNPQNYFYPSSLATGHVCSAKWSGNFLNWAGTQTIDPFRGVLTGGYRVVDTTSTTVIEKAWASGQGGTVNFPDASLPNAYIAGATPFGSSPATMSMRIQGLGNKMRFSVADNSVSFTGSYYNNTTFSGSPALTRVDPSLQFDWNTVSPDPAVSRTNMSVSWTGSATAPTTGAYVFQISADDTVKLVIDGTTAVNQTGYINNAFTSWTSPSVAAGHVFAISVQFTQGGGGSQIYFNWQKPGTTTFVPVAPAVADVNGSTAPTAYNPGMSFVPGALYDIFMRTKVCDASGGTNMLESNCTAYGSNYKPEGLLQQYAAKIRFAIFGYLNDGNILRDGGVLRAKMKYVGPQQTVPGSPSITNPSAEWSASTGVFTLNPNSADASTTGNGATDSGVINYLNKFGESAQNYKTYDPVGELYYSAIRYFKNQGNVSEYTSASTTAMVDGFPVITAWDDPIQYSCQKNFILGIGDTNTHADANLPGSTAPTANEPSREASVLADTTVDAIAATNQVGTLEAASTDGSPSGFPPFINSSLGTYSPSSYWCCNNNSFGMAGLAYDSHTVDMRPNDFKNADGSKSTIQTVSTYWLDVLEGQIFRPYNQYWLATKFGGFTVPNGYQPYSASTVTPPPATWHTNTDNLTGSTNDNVSRTIPRPDNYYTANNPGAMAAGLKAAFADIASKTAAASTSFVTPTPQLQALGGISYGASYNAQNWTGSLVANTTSFDNQGNPTLTYVWNARDSLQSQAAVSGSVNGWDTGRLIATSSGTAPTTGTGVAFRYGNLSATETAAIGTTSLLNYLRGDASNEGTLYRSRAYLLGDITNSKLSPTPAPNAPYSDSNNPGYSSFRSSRSSRPTVVYVGANDGFMHAFNGALTGSPPGKELFAYMPSQVITGPTATPAINGAASLALIGFVHHFMVDATPVVYDIDFGKAGTSTSGSVDWRSVLIGGLGKGGKGYYALDVTSPENITNESTLASKVLWEFTDSRMGYSYGDPIVVKTRKYGWVAILASGYNNSDGKGYLFIINPKTGALLEAIGTNSGSTTTPAGLAWPAGFVNDYTDYTADAVYAGDLNGNLWRFDLTGSTGTYPAPTAIATLTNAAGNLLPITTAPLIEVDPTTLKRYIGVGTGKLLGSTDLNSQTLQAFYSIQDGNRTNFNTTNSFPLTRANFINATTSLTTGITLNIYGYYIDLGSASSNGVASRVINKGTAFSGYFAFAAQTPNGDVCNPSGNSVRYVIRQSTAKTALYSVNASGVQTPIANSPSSGFTTDLNFVNVAGRVRLEGGNDQSVVTNIPGNFDGINGFQRLNWREINLTN